MKDTLDPSRCKASVSDRRRWPSWHQCYRPPAEGCDGYCKLHAVKHGTAKPTGEKVYAVDDDFGTKPRLFTASVVRRTASQVVIDGVDLCAWRYRRRHAPADLHFTPAAAWAAYCKEKCRAIASAEAEMKSERRLLALAEAKRHV